MMTQHTRTATTIGEAPLRRRQSSLRCRVRRRARLEAKNVVVVVVVAARAFSSNLRNARVTTAAAAGSTRNARRDIRTRRAVMRHNPSGRTDRRSVRRLA